jgi:hypothetical protein
VKNDRPVGELVGDFPCGVGLIADGQPFLRRRRFAVTGHVEGDGAEIRREARRLIHPKTMIVRGGMQEQHRQALRAVLIEEKRSRNVASQSVLQKILSVICRRC